MTFLKREIEKIETVKDALEDRELKELTIDEAEELCLLASDFCILRFADVKDAIANGITYNSTQKDLMKLLDKHMNEISVDSSIVIFE